MTDRPRLSVSAAVEAFDVERRTLQRMLSGGQLDGASKDERGRWLIPVEALHAAGFSARQTWLSDATNSATVRDIDATRSATTVENTGRDSATTARDSATVALRQKARALEEKTTELELLHQRQQQLEQQLASEKRLREAAERNAEDLRMSLRMLEAGPSVKPARRRWWQRR